MGFRWTGTDFVTFLNKNASSSPTFLAGEVSVLVPHPYHGNKVAPPLFDIFLTWYYHNHFPWVRKQE
jgi:hypothetical protein